MRMKKVFICIFSFLLVWILLSRFVIFQNRWSDEKAYKVFAAKNVPLNIYDTLINGRHLHYAVTGPDTLPTLVFIHGSPGSWMNYTRYMTDVGMRSKFRIVGIDRPGFGQSDFGDAMRLTEQCDIILPVLRSLKNGKPMYLCGHSMGGPVVVQLAANAPELFHTIVIAAGAIDVAQEKKETWRRIMSVKPLSWCLPGAYAPSNTEILYLKKDLVPLQDEFKKVTCRVKFIHGDEDTWVPIENVRYGIKMLINAQSITSDTIFGAAHQIPWKNTDAFKSILLSLY